MSPTPDPACEELCFFVQVLDAQASPSAPLPPALEHQPVVDFTCDREGRLVGVSPVVKLFGWNPEELQSVAALDLVHPADRARAAAGLHTVILQPGVPVALPTLRFRDRKGTRFAVRIGAAVYKIVEEALTNVMRHASARSVTISLRPAGDTLSVVIQDDGEGFEPEHRAAIGREGVVARPPEGRR